MHVGGSSGVTQFVTMVTDREQRASESIFALVDSRDASSLRLQHSESELWVTDSEGVVLGRFPKGHPLTKPQTCALEIVGYEVIGNANDPTRPNLMVEIRTVGRDDDNGAIVA